MPNETSGSGYIYSSDQFAIAMPPGAGQVSSILSLPRGWRHTIIRVSAVIRVVFAGAGATRAFNVRKGSATGTVVATKTIVLADGATVGAVVDIPVTAAAADFLDGDALTLEWAAAGAVAYTAGEIIVNVSRRQKIQLRN